MLYAARRLNVVTKAIMAKTTTERAALHRDRKRRGIVAVVPIEIKEDWLDIIECCTDLRLDDYQDSNYSDIPMDLLRPAVQEFVDLAVKLATDDD